MSSVPKALFEPRSMVLVGSSELSGEYEIYSRLFNSLVKNVTSYKKGKTYIIDLDGKLEKSEKRIESIRLGQDLMLVLLPKTMIAKNLQKLISRQAKAILLVEGKIENSQLVELSKTLKKKRQTSFISDSIGVVNNTNGLVATPVSAQIPKGHISIISQDPCIAYNILRSVRATGINKLISVGDSTGTDEVDILNYLSHDEGTRVICVYINKLKNGRMFIEAIKTIAKRKPIIIFYGGVDQSMLFAAAVNQVGALQVFDFDEMLNVAGGLARQPPLNGEKIAIVTNFIGGRSVRASQAILFERYLLEEGLSVGRPSEETIKKIKNKFPTVDINKYINIGENAKADIFNFTIQTLFSDEKVDGVVVINCLRSTLLESDTLRKISEIAKKSKKKPVIDVAVAADDKAICEGVMSTTKLPVYTRPEHAARVLRALRSRGKQLEKLQKK